MFKKAKKFLLVALVACSIAPTAFVATPAHAQSGGIVTPYLLIDDVLDTYSAFASANDSSHNVSCYDEIYKSLSYRSGYSLKGTTILWSAAGFSPKDGYPGTVSRLKCNYRTW